MGTIRQGDVALVSNDKEAAVSWNDGSAVASTWRNADGSLAFKRPQDYAPVFES